MNREEYFHIADSDDGYVSELVRGMVEDPEVLARFSDICEKQFSSLTANRDRIKRFLDESIS
ncbi:MAG: hypothetical protein F4Y00_04690 [Bacteroidetes bacterium SB0662_bin_6]|nr:hypothetical protein [Bacteroidetes bacterium SB0668_bin_1]MYE04252.1 hypothetical protein [Bacteroidetes bacterium SB0662_bin_6]